MQLPDHVQELVDRNALFVISHSGGKDSQAMYARLSQVIPRSQLLVIHAHLPGVEWDGIFDHIRATIDPGVPFIITQAYKRDGSDRTFFNMVRDRGFWPSPRQRQCTSDLKRGPIQREIKRYLATNPQHGGLVVDCQGLRAEESAKRAKLATWAHKPKLSIAGRTWYEWLPIHDMPLDEVWQTIRQAGQEPHWAYLEGMKRLSCCFCIMASKSDLQTAARLKPGLFRQYCELEREIDQTFLMPTKGERKFLPEALGIEPEAPDLASMCQAE